MREPRRILQLDSATLRAALLDGLRHWARATGSTASGGMVELIDHQIAALRRAAHEPAAAAPPAAAGDTVQTDRSRFWWLRD